MRILTTLTLGVAVLAIAGCQKGSCGFGLHNEMNVGFGQPNAAAGGGSTFQDVSLTVASDTQVDLSPVSPGQQPTDVFLVPTSCAQLFNGPYPGSPPLCQVYLGPAAPNSVTGHVSLPGSGAYRVWLQGYTSNTAAATAQVQIGIWDHSCGPILN